MAQTGGCRFWPAWKGLECQMSILALLEWLGIEEVVFGMPGMAWKEGSRFLSEQNSLNGMALTGRTCIWPAWNGLQWRKLILA
jgi:hypothetical protein